ncbi:cupin domain-containing protein [bacterium]|nr:cupin domain-containing protein [bacterium]
MAEPDFQSESPALVTRSGPVDHQNLATPLQTKTPPHGRIELVNVGDATISRTRFQPGWKWSVDVKSQAGTESCQLLHRVFMVSGHLHIRMDDGTEVELGPGDAAYIPPGHDAWVVGNEEVVNIGFSHAGKPTGLGEDPSKD